MNQARNLACSRLQMLSQVPQTPVVFICFVESGPKSVALGSKQGKLLLDKKVPSSGLMKIWNCCLTSRQNNFLQEPSASVFIFELNIWTIQVETILYFKILFFAIQL